MTSATPGELCRITVVGPERRADLAVPTSITVSALMPVLLRYTEGQADFDDVRHEAWVLQRLGQAPFDPNGTPQTLDWLEGDELYLRPAEDPLPELDYDDLADGVATVVNRRADRWQPQYRRYLFLSLYPVALAVLGAVLVDRGPVNVQVGVGFGLSFLFLLAAVLAARRAGDHTLSLLSGTASCWFAGLAGASWVDGDPNTTVLDARTILAGAAAAAVVALVLALLRLLEPAMPLAPFLAIVGTAVAAILLTWLHLGLQLSPADAAGICATGLLFLIVFVPKMVLRAARLRGLQLPRTGEEMQIDSEASPAAEVDRKVNQADTYMSVLIVCTAVVFPVLFHFLMAEPGWVGSTIVSVLSSTLLLRARTFFGAWQRISLAVAGSAGYVLVIMMLSETLSAVWRGALMAGLLCLVGTLVLAALRPWPRRLLPIWEYMASILDVAIAVALIPLVLQLVGAYAWARGLFG
jgi:type VII secretion integral membrane protein EccD